MINIKKKKEKKKKSKAVRGLINSEANDTGGNPGLLQHNRKLLCEKKKTFTPQASAFLLKKAQVIQPFFMILFSQYVSCIVCNG